MSVLVRRWRKQDTAQCMDVLKEASWSNVWPSFLLTLNKRWFSHVTVMVAVASYLVTKSVPCFLFSILLVVFVTFLMQMLGTVYYIYRHLRDMKNV